MQDNTSPFRPAHLAFGISRGAVSNPKIQMLSARSSILSAVSMYLDCNPVDDSLGG
jgi:hypothetical protein